MTYRWGWWGRPAMVLTAMGLCGVGAVAAALPTAADVQAVESGQVLYRESYLSLSSGESPDFLSVQCSAVGDTSSRMTELDFSSSPWMPQVEVRSADGSELLVHYVNAKWSRESRSGDSGRSTKTWPRLGKNSVLLGVLPFYLAEHRDAIEKGTLDSVTVYEPADNSQRRLKVKSESLMAGGSERLRIDLYAGRLFSDDQKLISVELKKDNGHVVRYVGPADVFCGLPAEDTVIKTFYE